MLSFDIDVISDIDFGRGSLSLGEGRKTGRCPSNNGLVCVWAVWRWVLNGMIVLFRSSFEEGVVAL